VKGRPTGVLVAAVLGLLLVPIGPPAFADNTATAMGSSYAVKIGGPVTISARPTSSVTATADNASPAPVEQVVLNIPAAPVVSSGTFRAVAAASVVSGQAAKLQSVINSKSSSTPADHNARGYAAVENLAALPGNLLTADAVEAEAVARCTNNEMKFATAARVTDIHVAGVTLPQVITPTVNQVLVDLPLLGLKVVLWETNWNPSTGGTTDGSDTVFVNALHVTQSLLGIDLVTSHAEATGTCAAAATEAVLPAVLPRTGGGHFYLIGLGLLAAAALGVLFRRKVFGIS
jgi:LPXTG-motif cell wall-anchored protein